MAQQMQDIPRVDMTTGKPLACIWQFALPLMLGNAFNQLYNVVDTAIVGRFVGSGALAAVGTTGNLNGFLFMLVSGLCAGAGIIVAQYWSAKRFAELQRLLDSFAAMVLLCSAVIAVLGVTLAAPLLRLIQVPVALLPDAVCYLRVCTGFVLGNALYCAASAVLRSIGDSRTPLFAMIASSAVNVALDLLLVLGFGLGVLGVAIATVTSQFVSAAVCLSRLLRHGGTFNFSSMRPRFCPAQAALLVRFGMPTAVQYSLVSLGGMSVQGLVNSLGPTVMAAYTAVQRIDSVSIQIVVAITGALAVYTGQNIGAKNSARVSRGLYQTMALLEVVCLGLGLCVFLLRRQLLSIFLDPAVNGESIALGCEYLTVIGFAYLIAGVMNSYLNVIRGAGDVNIAMIAGVFELAARVFFAYTLTRFLGAWGIWLATPLSWGCGCILPVVRYYSFEWKKKAL